MNRNACIAAVIAVTLAGCATPRAKRATVDDAELARTYAPAMTCDYERRAVMPRSTFGQKCYKIPNSDTPIAQILDDSLVASLCPVKVTWAPGYVPSPTNTCKKVEVLQDGRYVPLIQYGDEFRINHWRTPLNGTAYQLVYRSATGVSHAPIKLLPDLKDGEPVGFWGKDMKHEYRVFLEFARIDTDTVLKYWRIEAFELGDECIADHKATAIDREFECDELELFDPDVPRQGSEGGGTEPPPR